jgi:hypothetical protein
VVVVVVEVAVMVVVVLDPGPEQGDPVNKILWASWAYVQPLLTFESEKPALHIITPPNAELLLYSLTRVASWLGVI